MSDADVLVAGGGPAGAACAIMLARGGRRVVLVERETGPREKVCGEFLGADALACLAALGLDPFALGGVRIAEAQVARGRGTAGFVLPFAAAGLPRRVLDEALLDAAIASGVTLLRGASVRDAVRESRSPSDGIIRAHDDARRRTPGAGGVNTRDHGMPGGAAWSLRLSDGTRLRAPHLVLATGKHALRGFVRAGTAGGSVGAKLHLRLRAPLRAVTLLPCAGGYAGLQPSGDGAANLCAALAAHQVTALQDAATFVALVRDGSPLGAALLDGARPLMQRPLAVAGVPYGFLHRDPVDADPALWRLGDQFAVIPSLLGDGMAMAMASGMAAAAAMLGGETAPAFHAAWRRRLVAPMRIAGLVGHVFRQRPGVFAGIVAMAPGVARLVARRTRVITGEAPRAA
ncbi:NAD(P)/FAD-dependent oxidoreductase [Neoroseomonas lacus]|uniref:FAD-dependent oxidoreductase n=1 Tax=Neoroseomonas lacus TaxID=287609 RepID=A0A917NPT0_9PROT|nr:FAD-dependent monooxygenase [Neoroseomonas lacus]GGJ17500.1 FAD-dependent oxidoreductase [Neoroseomonas lacus]